MNNGKIWWWIVAVVVVVVIIVAAVIYQSNNSTNVAKPELNTFAQCLASKDWTMYGAYWCPHCQDEKRSFGSAFQYVNYVECTEQEALCLEKKVGGYPTWIGPTGEHHEGEQGLQKLSELSGCPLPAGY